MRRRIGFCERTHHRTASGVALRLTGIVRLAAVAVTVLAPAAWADPDLPGPAANLKLIPRGSLVIPMDNDKQNVVSPFNLTAYGLVTDILHNDIPVDWAIRAGKAKDGIDFSANAKRVFPAPEVLPADENFRGGPFIIHRDFASFVIPRIVAYGNDVAVYELTEDVTVDVRYTLLHKPKVAVFDDGGNASVHTDVLSEAGFVTPTHYGVITAVDLTTFGDSSCFTMATEPHWAEDPEHPDVTAATAAVRGFVEAGGNFLAQCAAIEAYENNSSWGRFQTTLGIVVNNTGDEPFLYPNADLAYSQFDGILFKGGGSVHDWEFAVGSNWQNNGHFHAQDTPQTNLYAATVSKLSAGTGSLVHYLSTHSYADNKIEEANGRRMYLNAVMTPAGRPPGCLLDLVLRTISGTVYEDVNGDGNLGDAVAAPEARIRFYADNNNDGLVDPLDTYVSDAWTDAAGGFEFLISLGLTGSKYLLAVDSKTIATATGTPSVAFNGGFGQGDVWPEQIWGDDPATPAVDVGLRYGGRASGVSDDVDPSSTAPADNVYQHVGRADVSVAAVAGVDFAFAFNVVSNTADGDDDAAANRWVQGSLRQFLQNANALSGADSMRFAPSSATNASGLGGAWWRVGVSGAALPAVTDADTTIDGTAYCAWNDGTQGCVATSQVRDDNPGLVGNPDFPGKAVGTGVDGVEGTGDEPTLPNYDRPEFEIDGNDIGVILDVAASNVTIRRIALFDGAAQPAGIRFSAGTGGLLTESVVGALANGASPAPPRRLRVGVLVGGGVADVTDNFVAYADGPGIVVRNTALVRGNDVYEAAGDDPAAEGISMEGSVGQSITIRENRVDSSGGYGIDSWIAPGPFTIEDNTVSRSGDRGGVENGGIRVFGTGSTVRHNVVSENPGAGIVLAQRSDPGSNQQNTLSRNAVYTNGGISIDLDVANIGLVNPNGDGVTPNDGSTSGTLPNIDLDYPVMRFATVSGSTLYVGGYVGTASSKIGGPHTIEVFKAADDGNNNGEIEAGDTESIAHGEGRWYLDSCTSAADGTFNCNLTVPGAVPLALGDAITATARNGSSNTSEFGANAIIGNAILGTVFEDVNYGGGPGRDLATARADAPTFAVERPGVTVELYDLAGILLTAQATAADGSYLFAGLAGGDYTVRVVNDTVTSCRPGSDGSELGVQTFRASGVSEAAGDGAKKVGGERPSNEDAAANSGAQALATLQGTDIDADGVTEWTQSIVTVRANGAAATNIDFGFNFSTVVNTNDTGQGSLRQFILNSNLLN